MIEKLIIVNKTDLTMADVTIIAGWVVSRNDIPDKVGDLYFFTFDDGCLCAVKKNRKSYTLTFMKEE